MTFFKMRSPLVLLLGPWSLAWLLTACGTSAVSTGPVDYGSVKTTETRLEVPPDLTKLPNVQNRYAVPGQVVSATQVGQNQAVVQQQVAPNEVGDVRFQRDGKLAWLSVKQTPEAIWPLVRAFWLENGFTFSAEDMQAGILETEWAENRAKLPQDFVRKALGRVFDMLASTGEKDKFRVRIERTAQGADVFVSHRGIEEVYTNTVAGMTATTKWQPRASDPFLETEFLRRLMVKLGSSQEAADRAVEQPQDVRQATLGTQEGQAVLTYKQPLSTAWRHVGLALDRLGFTIQERDASRGLYFLRYIDPRLKEEEGVFKRILGKSAKPEFPSEFRIELRPEEPAQTPASTQVRVLNNLGQADASEEAKHILQKLLESLQ